MEDAFIELSPEGEIIAPPQGTGTEVGKPLSELELFTTPGALQPLLDKVKNYVAAFPGADVTTETGRKAIKSFAFKITRTRTTIEARGKAHADEVKSIPKKIDAGRKTAREFLEALEDEFRAPLTAWEQADTERKDGHARVIRSLMTLAETASLANAVSDLRSHLEGVQAMDVSEAKTEEFHEEYLRARDRARDALTKAIAEREKYEADQAELAELRRQQAERDAADRQREEEAAAAQREEQRKADEAAASENEACAALETIICSELLRQTPKFIDGGYECKDIAKAIIVAIAQGRIPRATINY